MDPTTQKWVLSSSAAAIAILATGILRAFNLFGEWSLVGVFGTATVVLIFLALRMVDARPRLNLTVAAETIVALGILSLITSISVVLYSVQKFLPDIATRDLSPDDIRLFTLPFVEGLAAAAIAPVTATLLRHIEGSFSAIETTDTGIADAAREAATLADELKQTTANIRSINAELSATEGAFESAMTSAVRAVAALGGTLQSEAERLKVALQRLQAEATGFAEASEQGRLTVNDLGVGLKALHSSSKDARELLDALGKLIDSVERYIRPDGPHP